MPIKRPSRPASPSRRERDRRGAAAVEFALVMLPLLTLTLGIIQYGWWFYTAQSASSGGREAARRLSVGDCQTGTQARDFAAKQANVMNLGLTFGTADGDSAITN